MPKRKDFKRLVRARMHKTGESYTSARLRLVARRGPRPDFAKSAGMSDASVRKATGRTVGYERIRGLRDRGQRRGGGYTATKSRTFAVSLRALFDAFADASARGRWLSWKVVVRSATAGKRMRLSWEDGTTVLAGFLSKGGREEPAWRSSTRDSPIAPPPRR